MKRRADNNCLLGDVIAEAEPVDFRTALLVATLRDVRRRRRRRHFSRVAAPSVLMAWLAWFGWQTWRTRGVGSLMAGANFALVHTELLAREAIVTTTATKPVPRVGTGRFAVIVHTTTPNGGVRWIDDRELLSIASPRPAVLVQVSPETQALIFIEEQDRGRVE